MSQAIPSSIAGMVGAVIVFGIIGLIARRRDTGRVSVTPGTSLAAHTTAESNTRVSATLLSASVTTGWLDWAHGELWLLTNGLFRCSSGLLNTALHAGSDTVIGSQAKQGTLDSAKLPALLAANKRTLFIDKSAIQSFTFSKGPVSGKLVLTMTGGKKQRLLFLVGDMDYDLLEATLQK